VLRNATFIFTVASCPQRMLARDRAGLRNFKLKPAEGAAL
jgi:hypothetical protein